MTTPPESWWTARSRLYTPIDGGYESQCWQWARSIDRGGYGRLCFWHDGQTVTCQAHRAVYEHMIGAIPEGLVLDHLCRVRSCVNPAHLEPVTFAENVRRGERAQMTHCDRGHAFTPDNTYWRKSGTRMCRECQRSRGRSTNRGRAVAAAGPAIRK